MKALKTLFLILLFLHFGAYAQKYKEIKGTVVDQENHQPIPSVFIYSNENNAFATVSNDSGEFELKVPATTKRLIFSHVSYKAKEVTKLDSMLAKISMTPTTIHLDTVVVHAVTPEQYIQKAYEKALENKHYACYGKSYLQQITFNNSTPVAIFESFYDIKLSNKGIEKKSIAQGRFAIKKNIVSSTSNFSYLTQFPSYTTKTKETDLLTPLTTQYAAYYDFEIMGSFVERGRHYLKIAFHKKEKWKDRAGLEGYIILNKENFQVQNINGVVNFKTPELKVENPKFHVEDEVWTFNVSYYNRRDSLSLLSNMDFSICYKIFKRNKFLAKTKVNGTLITYDLNSNNKKLFLHKYKQKSEDLAKIKQAKYTPEFWKNNAIIKHTAEVQDLIDTFNKKNSFGTLIEK